MFRLFRVFVLHFFIGKCTILDSISIVNVEQEFIANKKMKAFVVVKSFHLLLSLFLSKKCLKCVKYDYISISLKSL